MLGFLVVNQPTVMSDREALLLKAAALNGFECHPIKPLQSLYTPVFWDGETQVQYLL